MPPRGESYHNYNCDKSANVFTCILYCYKRPLNGDFETAVCRAKRRTVRLAVGRLVAGFRAVRGRTANGDETDATRPRPTGFVGSGEREGAVGDGEPAQHPRDDDARDVAFTRASTVWKTKGRSRRPRRPRETATETRISAGARRQRNERARSVRGRRRSGRWFVEKMSSKNA